MRSLTTPDNRAEHRTIVATSIALTWKYERGVIGQLKPILAILILFAAVSSSLAKEESEPLSQPVSDKIYTFQQIEKQKAQLKVCTECELAAAHPIRSIRRISLANEDQVNKNA